MLHAALNDTKWEELRLAMCEIDPAPRWITRCAHGFESSPDREWFHHFRAGGYGDVVHVDILADDDRHLRQIEEALKVIHVPGMATSDGFRVFGYIKDGQQVGWL